MHNLCSILFQVWVIVVFLLSRKWKKIPHCITLCLAISQVNCEVRINNQIFSRAENGVILFDNI